MRILSPDIIYKKFYIGENTKKSQYFLSIFIFIQITIFSVFLQIVIEIVERVYLSRSIKKYK